ncbi:hypothetical protein EDD18DRAFT_1108328 [Armillaria luteobubalina]|uniref:Uncharacterized protein n=1 Tax=Armillaria luteobubalina TaxID=153913 RepID=A0AA39Q0H3_9AGAR|nr:hypothetical protein EDD18DRAFT_1108328 [Armillaria luteobubalina]
MKSSPESIQSKQEKHRESKKAYEERNKKAHREKARDAMRRRRENLKNLPPKEQQAHQDRKIHYTLLQLNNQAERGRSYSKNQIFSIGDCPQNMPDDRVYRKGHLYHPEDYRNT